ncbi:enoyl-CoA hydratase/carnithine racemase [Mycobacterium sp. JS623]|uniref:crotonase/enoyl-CoA hydratase family protein n=1 Tax=Mycobacterium sp. JS623 TaxID=212767 RepID=UPI0002A563E5|nr:crotonase/enoyl-CoA hydratase family protein [Mycobacterium sp. JS623]AGB23362.1 enoyl-CoA hydratase/carnithine racemase [Mycobacterium sp. JS623]
MPTVIVDERNHVLHMGLNRPAKRNAFDVEMLEDLGRAYERLERDDTLRAGVLYAEGANFTAGLDLAEIGPRLMEGTLDWPDDARNPWRNDGRGWTKPIVAAAQGWCMTLGIELLLAADIRIASADTRFAQLEVQRGIYPFGGATTRLPRDAGWGNSMRWLLTGDEFDAAEALRIGLVQEVVEPGRQRDRAVELAERIATRSAPLAVSTTLGAAQRANREGEQAAEDRFVDDVLALFRTTDGAEGIQAFIERRAPRFAGA